MINVKNVKLENSVFEILFLDWHIFSMLLSSASGDQGKDLVWVERPDNSRLQKRNNRDRHNWLEESKQYKGAVNMQPKSW